MNDFQIMQKEVDKNTDDKIYLKLSWHRADVHWISCELIFSLIRVRNTLWEDITQGKL